MDIQFANTPQMYGPFHLITLAVIALGCVGAFFLLRRLREGILLRDGTRCLPARLEILGPGSCRVTVSEGKYHQVRRMLASRGLPVLELRRIRIGGLELDEKLGPGGWKELNSEDLCRVFSS